MSNPVSEFQGEFRFLSNFWPVPIHVVEDGLTYPSVEHAYQAAKAPKSLREDLIPLRPGEVKRWGRFFDSGFTPWEEKQWVSRKFSVMENLVALKFNPESRDTRHQQLVDLLLQTGDRELVEGNTWGDRYWGVCDGVGENHLGKILMARRHAVLNLLKERKT